MKLLALDTSTEACSAAVLVDDEVIERYEFAPRRHTSLILPMIDAVLAEADLGIAQLDGLAFGRGPGTFTGVRIATGVVQGIAFAADLPVMPISTLAAIARETIYEHNVTQVAAALDARMEEVYWGAYRDNGDGGVVLVGEERVCAPDSIPVLDDGNGAWYGAGSGWMPYVDLLKQRCSVKQWWGDCYPRAGDIAMLGALAYQSGEMVSAEQALPIYLRDKVTHQTKA